LAAWLVVEGESAEELAVEGEDSHVEVGDEDEHAGVFVGAADADVLDGGARTDALADHVRRAGGVAVLLKDRRYRVEQRTVEPGNQWFGGRP